MGTKNYRFKLGTFDCIVVSDGTFAYPHPAATFFANAPAEPLAEALREHNFDPEHWDEYVTPYKNELSKDFLARNGYTPETKAHK